MFPIHRGLIPFVICCLLLVAAPKCLAETDPINSALPAAKAWLEMIDAGQYDQSYDAAGQGLYVKVPDKKQWTMALKVMRSAWGAIISRNAAGHIYQPNGIIGLNGECMAIAFDTLTQKDSAVREMVMMRFEDGKWRGVGYTMSLKSNGQEMPPPASETTSQTIPSPARTAHKPSDAPPP